MVKRFQWIDVWKKALGCVELYHFHVNPVHFTAPLSGQLCIVILGHLSKYNFRAMARADFNVFSLHCSRRHFL